jgi:hypothetical protein
MTVAIRLDVRKDERTPAMRDAAQGLADSLIEAQWRLRVALNVRRRTVANPRYLRELRD